MSLEKGKKGGIFRQERMYWGSGNNKSQVLRREQKASSLKGAGPPRGGRGRRGLGAGAGGNQPKACLGSGRVYSRQQDAVLFVSYMLLFHSFFKLLEYVIRVP